MWQEEIWKQSGAHWFFQWATGSHKIHLGVWVVVMVVVVRVVLVLVMGGGGVWWWWRRWRPTILLLLPEKPLTKFPPAI